mmetsp:Transcript_13167/g.20475  ORF Transcript_13167/g.20475 Transcript_13167/m.20475 type:complete len:93 (+) Transcript_13167:1716-1994(+)
MIANKQSGSAGSVKTTIYMIIAMAFLAHFLMNKYLFSPAVVEKEGEILTEVAAGSLRQTALHSMVIMGTVFAGFYFVYQNGRSFIDDQIFKK